MFIRLKSSYDEVISTVNDIFLAMKSKQGGGGR